MGEGVEDAELIRRTIAGDRNAFEGLVRRYHSDLQRALRRITRSLEDAEDLTQEAFLRAYRALDRFDLERPFRPWLWTIGIRLALHAISRKDRKHARLDSGDPEDAQSARHEGGWLADRRPIEEIEERLTRIDLEKALEALDPDQRAALILRVVEERSYDEISEILGIPKGTVMSRLFRARLRLRGRLSQDGSRRRAGE